MLNLISDGIYLLDGEIIDQKTVEAKLTEKQRQNAYKGTMAHSILERHNTTGSAEKGQPLQIKFDAITSHDITYVGIIQTARASGLTEFPIPYVLTNCHNSLCAVGGTINEDDHVFGLSAAKKYGGIFVPPHIAVIHQYMREMVAGCGKMILGSDSHTRYGALGTMAIGEGGPELVKQILKKTYDITYPDVVAVKLTGKVKKGVGPQDVALAIIGATFKNGFVKNAIMEFFGDGIKGLSVDFRCGIDVMTTETTCLSSIWQTDDVTKNYFDEFGRSDEFKLMQPARISYYDRAIIVDLDKIKPMIAMPFHPSNVYEIDEVVKNPYDIFRKVEGDVKKTIENPNINYRLTDKIINGKIIVEQGIIAGCAGGTYENIAEAANILNGSSIGNDEFTLSVYPSSQPVYDFIAKSGIISSIVESGGVVKTAFCGPCFGAGDTPSNNAFSIRHTTRNFPSREGSKPGQNQIASVALMDARSIAATAKNGGVLTAATDVDYDNRVPHYSFNAEIYKKRVYFGKNADTLQVLKFGPNIADWPKMQPLGDNMLVKIVSAIFDDVTTTDELIPSGETSSYRSNPMKLAEFTLSRKDPAYVQRAKDVKKTEDLRLTGKPIDDELTVTLQKLGVKLSEVQLSSAIFAIKPGDGSAREQAASCQRVLGAGCNFAMEYATKRYRSNLINWGMVPFVVNSRDFAVGDYILIKNVRSFIERGIAEITAKRLRKNDVSELQLSVGKLTDDERQIILDGCLINFYAKKG